MPIEWSEQQTPSGMPYLRVDSSGVVEVADAQQLMARLKQGDTLPKALVVVADGTHYMPETRRFLPTLAPEFSANAVVVTSPMVRAAVNLMVRIGIRRGPTMFRMFGDQAEALAWLEQQPLRPRDER